MKFYQKIFNDFLIDRKTKNYILLSHYKTHKNNLPDNENKIIFRRAKLFSSFNHFFCIIYLCDEEKRMK